MVISTPLVRNGYAWVEPARESAMSTVHSHVGRRTGNMGIRYVYDPPSSAPTFLNNSIALPIGLGKLIFIHPKGHCHPYNLI